MVKSTVPNLLGGKECLKVWFQSFCQQDCPVEELGQELRQQNIQLTPFHPDCPNGHGILLLSEVTPQACDFVRTISRDQNERILVLSSGQAFRGNGDPWQILQAGASDFLAWNPFTNLATVIAAKFQRWQEVDDLVESPLVQEMLVGQSRLWKSVLSRIVEISRFTDDPIVLVGETGTGKELAARLCHALDLKRNGHELSILDCTTIVPELSGSELFGHEKGAFTGAVSNRDGAFALADGGTLFLDEVGELPMSLQIQLLRVLQEHTYKRVGSNLWKKADFRLVCATNRDLGSDQAQGQFRKDLYYRIAHWVIRMPPLSERIEDIPPLIRHFIQQSQPDREPPAIDEKVLEYFLTREYPGNVRDLRNLVFRVMARHVGPGPVTLGDIPSDERPPVQGNGATWDGRGLEQSVRHALASGLGLREIKDALEETVIGLVLENERGNVQRAAKVLGVTDRTVQKHKAERTRVIREIASP